MKIVICLLMFAISSCFAGLLGSSGINLQDNLINSGPNTGYYGNYGIGRLALKYLSTTTPRGYSGSSIALPPPPIPLFMRLGAGKIIGSGVLSPIPVNSNSVPITSSPVQIGSGSYSYNTPNLLRITTRQSNVFDPYRSSNILGGNKILGVLPSTTIPTTYSNLNAFTSPLPYKILRVIQGPSVPPYNFPLAHPLFATEAVHRNQYQPQYNSPSPPMTHPQTTTAIFPTMNNPSHQSYTTNNYGNDATIRSMSNLPPELANAIMKILNESSAQPTTSTAPVEQHSTNHYIPGGPAPIESNSIDNTENGSTNDVQVSKPYNSGSSNYGENRYY